MVLSVDDRQVQHSSQYLGNERAVLPGSHDAALYKRNHGCLKLQCVDVIVSTPYLIRKCWAKVFPFLRPMSALAADKEQTYWQHAADQE